MKKVININFQGRVIPIEESAYEMLQQYTASLRGYFADEEGRDEIINDIESRIGELFAEQLKKGSACITDANVNAIMDSMGRPADFEMADEEVPPARTRNTGIGDSQNTGSAGASDTGYQQNTYEKKRLYRDEEDKILGGVASGLANYLNIDPAIMRILFAVTAFFGGFGFLIYIILWIVLPSKSLVTNIRKRLYRDSEDKVFGGVCGGLAKYFDISVAIPRVIFAAPFIFGLITSIGRNFFMSGPVYIGGFSGGTFIITYIILWIVLPEAVTAAEKLEMRGEKIDLNSIRNTIMDDMKGFKGRAEKIGKDFGGTAQDMSDEAKRIGKEAKQAFQSSTSTIMRDTSGVIRRSRGGLGNAIGVLIKAFVIFIAGIIAISLFAALIFLLGSGMGYLPLKDYLLEGLWQNLFAWGTLLFFVGVPVIAFITWIIRQLMRVKTRNRFIGYSFSALWVVGWFCLIALFASLSRNFSTMNVPQPEDASIVQPANGKLLVTLSNSNYHGYNSWLDFEGAVSVDSDSLYLNTVRVNLVRSSDSLYHVHVIKQSKGRDNNNSKYLAEKINFQLTQKDSVLYLPASFGISKHDKWRNQRVVVVIEIPVGKRIRMDNSLNDYDYFNIDFGNRRNRRSNISRDWENGEYWWQDNKDLIMTTEDLVPVYRKGKNSKRDYRYDEVEQDEENIQSLPSAPGEPAEPAARDSVKKKDSTYRYSDNTNDNEEDENVEDIKADPKNSASLNFLSPLASFF